jgi:hypothetical protein
MDDSLIDDEQLQPERRSVLPGEGFFVPDSFDEALDKQEAQEALDGVDVAVVADPDADGLACVALLREAFGEAALVPAGPHDLEDGLEYVAEYGESGIDVFVCDLCPDRFAWVEDELDALLDRAESVRWFDHHQWDEEVAQAVRDTGVDLVIGDSEVECTADVALRSIDYDFPSRFEELAEVTRDHDLWIKEDTRSDDLADFSRWSEDEATYIETIREHGADLPEDAMELLEERRVRKQDHIERAVRRAEYHEIGPWTIGVTYGRCSQNEVAEAMREQGADASIIVKPSGPASIRGTEAFDRCHEVAEQVNGGGHPKAAGCKPDVYDDMLDYAHHWSSQGAVAKRTILSAFETLAEEVDAEAIDEDA